MYCFCKFDHEILSSICIFTLYLYHHIFSYLYFSVSVQPTQTPMYSPYYFEQTLHTVPVVVKRCCPIWAISTSILNILLYIVEVDFCPQYALNTRSLSARARSVALLMHGTHYGGTFNALHALWWYP
jgi:hypothetical protein